MPGRQSGRAGICCSHWMSPAKANESIGVWFIAQPCQSGQHGSDPRPQAASDEWMMRVSDPADWPPTPSSPLSSPLSTPTCPRGRQNPTPLTGASGSVSSAPEHTLQSQLPSLSLSQQRTGTHVHTNLAPGRNKWTSSHFTTST